MSYSMPFPPSRADSERELRRRMSPLQTSDSKTALTSRPDQMKSPAPENSSSSEQPSKAASGPTHQRFVLTDPVAARYLEDDPATTVLSRRQKLEGYEVFLVEQWACSRSHPTFVITTFTGDPKDVVWGSVISVPNDEAEWAPQMRLYFKSLAEYHARKKETTAGTLMITNLSSFPSSLTIIPIPQGDPKKYRELFFVNENLKRLGCSGRLGIKLVPPSSATQAKFHQLYRTDDKILFNSSVIELVKLCQVALVIFGSLEPEYADGLLCDVTEKAINDWWLEFGSEYYTVEPHDGILGPTTVSALLGMLMGARNRLSAFNAPVSKDVFDIESTKRGINYFQKTQRIQRTRRLDRQTLERLRRATAKAASKEGWAVPRAFKSTVAELGGKGGEMVMGMVGAGEKAGIADVETVDFERFVELVRGERAKWLWYGKPRKKDTGDMFNRLDGRERSTSPDEHSEPASSLKRESTLEDKGLTKRDTATEDGRNSMDVVRSPTGFDKERDPNSKRAAIKKATGKIESGSGFHRIKDVVGRRSHQSKLSKDENGRILHTKSDLWSPLGIDGTIAAKSRDSMSEATSTISRQRTAADHEPSFTKTLTETPHESTMMLTSQKPQAASVDGNNESAFTHKSQAQEEELSRPPTAGSSMVESVRGLELDDRLPFNKSQEVPLPLRRSQSTDQLGPYHANNRNGNWWPRHLSFSITEESILKWTPIASLAPGDEPTSNERQNLATQQHLSVETKRLHALLSTLSTTDASWVTTQLNTITGLSDSADADLQQLEDMYYPRLEAYHSLREDAHEIISRERMQFKEHLGELTNLGDKLEYEIGSLRSKVDDVEDGVMELERQVEYVEGRLLELESVIGEREGWLHWGFRILTGIGRPPC